MVDLFVLGIVMRGEEQTPLLLLHPYGTEQILPVRINSMEAFAVSAALYAQESGLADTSVQTRSSVPDRTGNGEGAPDDERMDGEVYAVRPVTHDLMLRLIRSMGGKLLHIDILREEQGVFLAEAVLSHNSTLVRASLRPADGAALALRSGATLRATQACLKHARDFARFMDTLSEQAQCVIKARLAAQVMREYRSGHDRKDGARTPVLAEGAIVAQKVQVQSGRVVVGGAPQKPVMEGGARKKTPTIRISLVRQDKTGETEVLDEFRFQAEGVPDDVMQNLRQPAMGARQAPGESSGDAGGDDERWAALLRILSPETKVPM